VLALLLVAVSLGLPNFAAAAGIGVVSVTMSLLGLELGDRLGTRTGERGELLGGLVLIAASVAVASGSSEARPPSGPGGRDGAERPILLTAGGR
jgi:Putative manganese efflux pump